jgi:hypothetical protein
VTGDVFSAPYHDTHAPPSVSTCGLGMHENVVGCSAVPSFHLSTPFWALPPVPTLLFGGMIGDWAEAGAAAISAAADPSRQARRRKGIARACARARARATGNPPMTFRDQSAGKAWRGARRRGYARVTGP